MDTESFSYAMQDQELAIVKNEALTIITDIILEVFQSWVQQNNFSITLKLRNS